MNSTQHTTPAQVHWRFHFILLASRSLLCFLLCLSRQLSNSSNQGKISIYSFLWLTMWKMSDINIRIPKESHIIWPSWDRLRQAETSCNEWYIIWTLQNSCSQHNKSWISLFIILQPSDWMWFNIMKYKMSVASPGPQLPVNTLRNDEWIPNCYLQSVHLPILHLGPASFISSFQFQHHTLLCKFFQEFSPFNFPHSSRTWY